MDISLSLRKLRRTIAGLSLLAVLVTMSFAGVAKAQTFTDVDSDSWYYEYVETLVEQGAVAGYDNATFGPANYLTRAEAAKIMVLAYVGEDELDYGYDAGFSDVDENAWYAVYVNTAAKLGIVGGYTDADGDATGKFGPGDFITRAAFAKMVVGSAGLETDTTDAPHFSDVADGTWYYDYVETAYNNTVIDGYSNGTFGPGNNVNRAEACKMVVLGETPTLRYDDEECDAGYEWDGDVCVEVVVDEECDAGFEWDTDTETCIEEDVTISDGTLEVVMGDEIDGATLPKGATSVEMLNVEFTAEGGDVELDGFIVHRTGVGSSGDFDSLYVYEGDTRLTSGKSIASDTNSATFGSLNLVVEDGETVVLTIVADVHLDPAAGNESALELTSADVVESNASEVSGTFAIVGDTFTIGGSTVGTMTIAKNGAVADPTLGDEEAEVAEFQLSAASEDMAVTRLALVVKGTVDATALSNFKLWQGSTVIATASAVTEDELAVFVVDGNYNCSTTSYEDAGYCITKGNSKTFNVTADIGAGTDPLDQIKIYLDEKTDLTAIGLVYGYGAQVTDTNYDGADSTQTTTTDSSWTIIQGGQFTVSSDSPSSTDVAINAKDVILNQMAFTSERNIEVEELTVALTASVGSGLIADAGASAAVANFTDIKLVKLDADGSIEKTLMGPGDLSITGSDATQTITFTDTWSMSAGESYDVAITCDIANNSTLTGTTITANLNHITDTSLLDVDTNEYVTDIVPSSTPTVAGNPMTVRAATLAVSFTSAPYSDTFVQGTSDLELASFALTAGAAMDVTIDEMVMQGYIDEESTGVYVLGVDNLVYIQDVVTTVWLEDSEGNQVGDSESFSTAGNVTFSGLSLLIAAGDTEVLKVYGNISSEAPFNATNDKIYVDIDDVAASITSYDEESNPVTETGASSGPNGTINAPTVVMTISAAGTLAIAEDTETQISNQIAVQGDQDVLVARFKLTAADEDWKVTKMTFTATGISADGLNAATAYTNMVDDLSGYTLKYPTDVDSPTDLDGEVTESFAGTNVVFSLSSDPIMVGKDQEAYVEVYANLSTHQISGGGLDSDDGIRVKLNTGDLEGNVNGDFLAEGIGSKTQLTESSATVTDITATNVTYVYRTVPTVATVSLGSTLEAKANAEVYKFSVTADSLAPVVLKYLTLDINTTGLVTGNALNSLANIAGSDGTTTNYHTSGMCVGTASYLTAPWYITEAGESTVIGTGCYDTLNQRAKFDIGSSLETAATAVASSGVTIGQGSTKIFVVHADLWADSDATTDPYISATIHADSTHYGMTTLALLKGTNMTNLAATGMIWSDKGNQAVGTDGHSGYVSEWYVGYKVPGMPVSYQQLS